MIEVASGDYPRDLDLLAKEALNNGHKLALSSIEELDSNENGKSSHIRAQAHCKNCNMVFQILTISIYLQVQSTV